MSTKRLRIECRDTIGPPLNLSKPYALNTSENVVRTVDIGTSTSRSTST